MKCWQCETEFIEDGIKFCPDCQPFRPNWSGKCQASFKDGSSLEKGKFVSQRYYDSVRKRKSKKSDEVKAIERGEI